MYFALHSNEQYSINFDQLHNNFPWLQLKTNQRSFRLKKISSKFPDSTHESAETYRFVCIFQGYTVTFQKRVLFRVILLKHKFCFRCCHHKNVSTTCIIMKASNNLVRFFHGLIFLTYQKKITLQVLEAQQKLRN